ncbi:hypothetical protein CapIbe_000764 [Capra ibex]
MNPSLFLLQAGALISPVLGLCIALYQPGHEGEDGYLQTRHGLWEAPAALPAPPPGMRRKRPVSAGPAALTGATCLVVFSDEIFQDVKMTAPGCKEDTVNIC